jgi:flagellar motor protein MotB
LDEAKGYFFPKGRASLSEEFTERLHGPIKDELAAHIGEYETDVIEVVGHTDEQPVRGGSNLDARLLDVLGGQSSADSLSAADNVGLGMARAAAVAKVLAEALAPLVDVKVIAYSAGQTVEPGDVLSRGLDRGDSQGRRRIEIRLRRSVQSP